MVGGRRQALGSLAAPLMPVSLVELEWSVGPGGMPQGIALAASLNLPVKLGGRIRLKLQISEFDFELEAARHSVTVEVIAFTP